MNGFQLSHSWRVSFRVQKLNFFSDFGESVLKLNFRKSEAWWKMILQMIPFFIRFLVQMQARTNIMFKVYVCITVDIHIYIHFFFRCNIYSSRIVGQQWIYHWIYTKFWCPQMVPWYHENPLLLRVFCATTLRGLIRGLFTTCLSLRPYFRWGLGGIMCQGRSTPITSIW